MASVDGKKKEKTAESEDLRRSGFTEFTVTCIYCSHTHLRIYTTDHKEPDWSLCKEPVESSFPLVPLRFF